MWRSPHEIGNEKYCGQHKHDTDAACCQTIRVKAATKQTALVTRLLITVSFTKFYMTESILG